MGNIISDIAIDDQIKSNIRNIQCKYELRGIIELCFASIIKCGNWDRFIIKICKQIDPLWTPSEKVPYGTFKLMCESVSKKSGVIMSNIINMDEFPKFMVDIKPINRPYALDCIDIVIDFPDGFDTCAITYELPLNELIAIREIYTDNMNYLQSNQFKYNSSDSDSDILQNLLLVSCNLRVSDALQLVNNIPIHGVYRRII